MNFPLLLPLIVTAVLAVAGWYAVHRLSMNRDQESKRRDLRIQYLLEAYRRLGNSSNRRDLSAYARDLESALADIQLLGSRDQVQLAHEFAVSMCLWRKIKRRHWTHWSRVSVLNCVGSYG